MDFLTFLLAFFGQDYVATRWYRAPELCGSFYTKVPFVIVQPAVSAKPTSLSIPNIHTEFLFLRTHLVCIVTCYGNSQDLGIAGMIGISPMLLS